MDEELYALRNGVGICYQPQRGLVAVLGEDRSRFLQGQITQNIDEISVWTGSYTTFVNNKGRMEGDGFVYLLPDEILLDLADNSGAAILSRLDKFIVADDVQVVNASDHYQLISLIGPQSTTWLHSTPFFDVDNIPEKLMQIRKVNHDSFGEIYLSRPDKKLGQQIDIFVPVDQCQDFLNQLKACIDQKSEKLVRDISLESLTCWRIHCGVPAYGVDLTNKNLPPEAGLDEAGISYSKGCYVGQEVLNRLRTMGSVAKKMVGLQLTARSGHVPEFDSSNIELYSGNKLVGHCSSASLSPWLNKMIGLAIVKKDFTSPGSSIVWMSGTQSGNAIVVELPFFNPESPVRG